MRTTWVARTDQPSRPIQLSHTVPSEQDLVGMITAENGEPAEFHQAPGTPLRADELLAISAMMRTTPPPH